jgi:hypothetical protein
MRNSFEEAVAKRLPKEFLYEPIKLPYVLECNYTPDFVSESEKIIIESKGEFDASDRRKMRAVKKQHPDWRIILVFQNPRKKIDKSSKTTYRDWAIKNGFEVLDIDCLDEI